MELCTKNVNMRIEESLLEEFKKYAGPKYQTRIKLLMRKYVEDMKKEEATRVKKDNSISTDFLTR